MNTRNWVCVIATVLFVGAFAVIAVNAGTTIPDVAQIKAPYEHTKTTVPFTHQKHITDHKIACGECHHDAQGKPLTNLKEGDDVKACFDCHNKPGEVKGKEAKGMSKEEKRAYHANALHDNCIGCHRDYNKQMKKKAAPQTCTECHPKN